MGQGRNPACADVPEWQVDGLAGDYAQLRAWALSTYRVCVIGRIDSSNTP